MVDFLQQPDMSSFTFDSGPANTLSENTKSVTAGQIASLRNAMDSESGLQEHYLAARQAMELTTDPTAITQGVTAEYNDYYKGLMGEVLNESLLDPVEAAETAQDVQEIAAENQEAFDKPWGMEEAHILAIEGKMDSARAERAWYAKQIADVVDGASMLGTVANFAGLLLPDEGIELEAATTNILGEGEGVDPFADWKRIIFDFQTRTQEERLKLFPMLLRDIMAEADDFGNMNEHKVAFRALQLIDPSYGKDVDIDRAFSVIEWAGMGASAIRAVTKIRKAHNTIRAIKEAGDTSTAARANIASAGDDAVAIELGMDKTVAADNMTPFNNGKLMPEAADGLSGDTAKVFNEIESRAAAVNRELDPVTSGKGYLREGALTSSEESLAQSKGMTHIEELAEEYYTKHGWNVTDAKMSEHSEHGFTLTYKLEGVEAEHVVKYTKNDVGSFDVLSTGNITSKIASPSVYMDKLVADSVEVATRMSYTQPRILNALKRSAKQASKGLSRTSRTKVDEVLMSGDDFGKGAGKQYTIMELRNGIDTGGIRLTDQEISSYYSHRFIYDQMQLLKNKQVRAQLDFDGFKQVDTGAELGGTSLQVAKPLERGTAAGSPNLKNGVVYDTRGNGSTPLASSLDIAKLYDEGYQVVKTKDAFKIGDESFTYAIVKAENIAELPMMVLNKKPGYVPKIYKDGKYFVKSIRTHKVNGKDAQKVSTHRIFDNKADGETWAAKQQETADAGVKYEVRHDRQLSAEEVDQELISESGGLFTGHRATEQLKYGLNGDVPARLSSHEAMMRNMQNLSNTIPTNEWRMGMVQRWTNSAKDYLAEPSKGLESALTAEVGSKLHTSLTASRDWIKDQLRMRTPGEERWNAMTRQTAEWMEGKPVLDGKIRRTLLDVGSKDPFSAMRGAAFHTLLGWFNPAQLWVQAQGASVALSLDPIHALPNLHKYTALRAAYFVRDNPGAVKATAKAMGVNPADLADTLKDLDRSGLFESVKNTADHAAAAQGFGTAMDGVRRWADRGLMFYTEGERFTRGYSFITARRRWMKASGRKITNDDDLKEVLNLTTAKMLNMSRANRAHWQKGAWSVPTQFQQVTAKFIENMLPNTIGTGKFTGGEKARIMVGQLALYGAAAVPLGESAIAGVMNMMGAEPGEVTEAQAAAITDGLWGFIEEAMFDERTVLGKRGAYLSGVEQLYEELFVRDVPMIDKFAGAFGTVPSRIAQGITAISPLVTNIDEVEWSAEEALTVFHAFGDLISTYRNAHMAMTWASTQQMTDSKGRVIANIDANDDMTMIMFKALGFTPHRLADHYELKNVERTIKDNMRETSAVYRKLVQKYGSSAFPSPEARRNFLLMKKWLLEEYSPEQRAQIIERVHDGILNEETEEDRVLNSNMKTWMMGGSAVPSATAQGLFTVGTTKED